MVFGRAALVPRCQIHKTRNILDHLPERQRSWVLAILKRAYQSKDVKTATRLLRHLARRLDQEHPCAAASVREGLEETVTVLTLGLSPRLQRSLATTNAAESLISRIRHVKRNVKRWRGGQMMLRWVAAGVLEAAKGFRRLKGHADMPQLVAALRARDLEETVPGLTNGQSYAVAVRAVNAAGAGPAAEVTATPVTTPGAPQDLRSEPGDAEVTLRWAAPASDGGSAILRYEYAVDDSGTWIDAGGDLEETVPGLTNGQSYAVAVRAVNAAGAGPAATVTASPVTTPGAPQRLRSEPGDAQVSRESQELACAVEAGYGDLPRPNIAAQRASSGHLHLGWNLRTPVHRGAESRPRPLAALGRIAE